MRVLRRLRYLIPTLCFFLSTPALAKFKFDKDCYPEALGIWTGKIENPLTFDPFYYGIPKGLSNFSLITDRPPKGTSQGNEDPYFLLNLDGCKALCRNRPEFHDADIAFQILTTWVLPILALFSNLPFESLSTRKIRSTFAALVNWIGSPQSAFTTTMFNIYQIRNCKRQIRPGGLRQRYIDSFFVLSCINQYYYERYATKRPWKDNPEQAKALEDKRNTALFYGLFRPLSVGPARNSDLPSDKADVKETAFLLSNLAYQLRMLRRKNVYPMTLNIAWFFLAFVLSLVLAFANLGDNTESHNLGLGIGLTWLPGLVFMTIVDRNPVSPVRCKILIERWLYNVNAIIEYNGVVEAQEPNSSGDTPRSDNPTTRPGVPAIRWWPPEPEYDSDGDETTWDSAKYDSQLRNHLVVDDFVGQGRRLRHCGVTNTVLERLDRPRTPKPDKEGFFQFMDIDKKVRPGESVTKNGWTITVSEVSRRRSKFNSEPGDERSLEEGTELAPMTPSRSIMRPMRGNAGVRYEVTLSRDKSRPRFHHNDTPSLYKFLAADFEKDLVQRPRAWWICWIAGGVFVGMSVGMALMLAYNTPPIGFGCRSMAWCLFWCLSSVSWMLQAAFQEPPKQVRWFSTGFNAVSFVWLMCIMLIQVMNGFNECTCATNFGASGLDFKDAQFYKDNYHVITWWAIAAAIGPLGGLVPICWTMRRWARSSELWKVDEDPEHPIEYLERSEDRKWEGDPLVWLT